MLFKIYVDNNNNVFFYVGNKHTLPSSSVGSVLSETEFKEVANFCTEFPSINISSNTITNEPVTSTVSTGKTFILIKD